MQNSLSCANDCSDSGDSTNLQFAMILPIDYYLLASVRNLVLNPNNLFNILLLKF